MSDTKSDESIAESLESVLCGPEGRCCIYGSDEDRRIVDNAITDVAIMERELAASRAEAEHLARDYNAVAQQSRDYQAEVGKLLVHRERLAAELEISKNETKHYRQLANHLGDEAAQPHTKLDELTAVLTNLCDWIDQLTILDIRKEDGSERRYDEVKQKAAWAREVLK